jgi:tetratricopeptide (TPR) repeat protein
VATGERAVAAGGAITDSVVITGDHNIVGDRNIVLSGADARTLKDVLALLQAQRRPAALHQLPPDIADFTGRVDEVARLTALLDTAADGTSTTIALSAMAGMAGVGKSALAVHVANRCKGRFPDGQLYVNLRGEGTPLDPTEALAALLTGLGVAPDMLPREPAERGALYRSLLADKRVLVLLDNAHDAAQVQPLLPNSPRSAALVTSRAHLATLPGAALLPLDVLSEVDALALLGRLAGDDRLQAEPEAAARILAQCGRLPLALRIAGARLKARSRRTLADEVTALADERKRLAYLPREDLDVRAAFMLSYRALPEADRRLFRLLGLPVSADIAQGVAAALAGLDPGDAEVALERLVDAQLVEEPAIVGRYRLHDLLRLFARELLDREEPPEAQQVAWLRLAQWYSTADAERNELFDPEARRRAAQALPPDSARPPDVVEHDLLLAALAWFDAEYRTIMAAIEQCHELRQWGLVRDLAFALVRFLDLRALWPEWQRSHELALAATRALGDRQGEAAILGNLGNVYDNQGRWAEAIKYLEACLAIYRALGDRRGVGGALNNLSTVYRSQGRWEEAIVASEQSLGIFRALGDRHGEGQALNNLGNVYRQQGRWAEAIAAYEQDLAICRALGDRHGEGATLGNLGIVYRQQGRWDEAIAAHEQARGIFAALGDRQGEGQILNNLGILHGQQERWDEAVAAFEQSLGIVQALGDRHGEGQILNNLGILHERQGLPEEARRFWREALTRLHPDSPEYRQLAAFLATRRGLLSRLVPRRRRP